MKLVRVYTKEAQSEISRKGNEYHMQEQRIAIVDDSTGEIRETKTITTFSDNRKVGECEYAQVVVGFDKVGDLHATEERPQRITPSEANKMCPGLVPPSFLKSNSRPEASAG